MVASVPRWQLSLSRPIQSDHDVTVFGAGRLTWQDPVHSWKAGLGEVMTVENKQTYCGILHPVGQTQETRKGKRMAGGTVDESMNLV